jgi:hypothetical protein
MENKTHVVISEKSGLQGSMDDSTLPPLQKSLLNAPHVDLAWVILFFVTFTQSVGYTNRDSGLKETKIIIPSIPKDDICFFLRFSQDHFVINACVQKIAFLNMKLIFLTT